jgi:hypothetical protein
MPTPNKVSAHKSVLKAEVNQFSKTIVESNSGISQQNEKDFIRRR